MEQLVKTVRSKRRSGQQDCQDKVGGKIMGRLERLTGWNPGPTVKTPMISAGSGFPTLFFLHPFNTMGKIHPWCNGTITRGMIWTKRGRDCVYFDFQVSAVHKVFSASYDIRKAQWTNQNPLMAMLQFIWAFGVVAPAVPPIINPSCEGLNLPLLGGLDRLAAGLEWTGIIV